MQENTDESFLMSGLGRSFYGTGEYDETKEQNKKEEASKLSTSFNYINSILGSGIIGMPYALMNAGVVLGMILFILISILSTYTLRLMVRNAEISGSSSYQGVMTCCFGRAGFFIISVIQFLFPFMAVVGYNVGVGDTLSKVFGAFAGEDPQSSSLLFLNRNIIIGVTCITILLPLSLYKNISKLSKASLLSTVAILFIITSVFIRYYTLAPPSSIPQNYLHWSGVPKAVGVMVFSYTCHQNSLMLYSSMKDKTEDGWAKVTYMSVSVVFLAVVLLSLAGYFTFLGDTQGDLLENYCYDDFLINISRVFFAMTLLLTAPIEIFVAREVLRNMFWSEDSAISPFFHPVTTGILVITSFLLSLQTDCLGSVMEILGLYTGVPLAFIFPSLCYLCLKPGPRMSLSSVAPLSSLLTGFIVIISGTFLVISEGMSSCSHGVSPQYCLEEVTQNMSST